jgi:hypothetical protein
MLTETSRDWKAILEVQRSLCQTYSTIKRIKFAKGVAAAHKGGKQLEGGIRHAIL